MGSYSFGGAGHPAVPPGRTTLTNPNVVVVLNPADRLFNFEAVDTAADKAVAAAAAAYEFFHFRRPLPGGRGSRALARQGPTGQVGGASPVPDEPQMLPMWASDP